MASEVIPQEDGTCLVSLTKGRYALVDSDDVERIKPYSWFVNCRPHTCYAEATRYGGGSRTTIRMHRLILEASDGESVDHVNRDGLDNRRCNLRIASPSQNCRNRYRSEGSSRFRGVCKVFSGRGEVLWAAQIGGSGEPGRHLGRFACEEDAARAYDGEAVERYGEYARTNASLGLFDDRQVVGVE